jgi:hypothetical protein
MNNKSTRDVLATISPQARLEELIKLKESGRFIAPAEPTPDDIRVIGYIKKDMKIGAFGALNVVVQIPYKFRDAAIRLSDLMHQPLMISFHRTSLEEYNSILHPDEEDEEDEDE